MRRYQILLCALAAIASLAAIWLACYLFYRQLIIFALALVFLALAVLTI